MSGLYSELEEVAMSESLWDDEVIEDDEAWPWDDEWGYDDEYIDSF